MAAHVHLRDTMQISSYPPPAHSFLKAQYSRQERVKFTVHYPSSAWCVHCRLPACNENYTSHEQPFN